MEADQEEENEEAGDMNDDELNELIARSEEECAIFRELDLKRERDILDNWRVAGHRNKPPPPLMQLEELPECYQLDEPFETKEAEEMPEGRGQRRRNVVSYNDGLSDDAWAMVCNLKHQGNFHKVIQSHRLWRKGRISKSCLSVLVKRKSDV